MSMQTEFLYKQETYRILGACFEVYKEKGCGFLEPVYQECLEIEFTEQSILFAAKRPIILCYRNRPLRQTFAPDFVCFESVIVEIKAVSNLADEHRAQLLNYLNASKLKVGLLVNFGYYPKLEYERLVNSRR